MNTDEAPVIWRAATDIFAGGMDVAVDPAHIEEQQFARSLNGYVARSGNVVKRNGYESLTGVDALPTPVRAIFRYTIERLDYDVFLVQAGDALYSVSIDGATVAMLPETDWLDYTDADYQSACFARLADIVYFSGGKDTGLIRLDLYPDGVQASSSFEAGTGTATFRAASVGEAGNDLSLVIAAVTPSQTLDVSLNVAEDTLTIVLGSDGGGTVTSNWLAVKAALEAEVDASAVFVLELTGDAGTTLVNGAYVGTHALAGGLELFAYQVPSEDCDYTFSYMAARSYGNRLFGIDSDDRDIVRYSGVGDLSSWASGSPATDNMLSAPEGGEFTALVEVGRVMVLAQANRFLRIDGSDPATWEVTKVESEGLGCASGASSTARELEGIVLCLSQRGLAVFDGTRPRIISDAVKNETDASANLIPLTPASWLGSFTVVDGDHIILFYRSADATDGCDRAIVYDYRRGVWSGPWTFTEEVTCGLGEYVACIRPQTAPAVDYSVIKKRSALFTDDDETYEYRVRTRTFTCGREAIDKQVITMRATYKTTGTFDTEAVGYVSCEPTLKLYREDETTAVETKTVSVDASVSDVIEKRCHHRRGRDFHLEFSDESPHGLELAGAEFDYFFVAVR